MNNDPDKIKALYNTVSKDYDVGGYDDFATKLQDSAKRRAFYDFASKSYDLGDYNSFESNVGVKKKVSGEPVTNGASPSPSQSNAAPRYEFGKGSLVGTPATPVQMPGEKIDETVHEDDPVGSAIQPHLNEHTKLVNEYNNSGLSQRQVSESTSQKRPTQTIVGSGKTYKENLQAKLQRTANNVNNTHEAVVNAVLPNVDAAKDFLDKTVAKNKGEIPQNNVTANLAIQKINDFKEREQAIKSAPDFTTAAIEDAARNNPTVAEQIKTIQEQNPSKPLKDILPGAMVGRMVDNFYKDKDNQDVINHNPELKEAFDNLGKNNLTDNPEYGANVVGNELSRARQAEGKNNPVANAIIGSSKYMDDLAARLYKNDPQKLAIYNDIVKKDFNKYIDTKDFVSSFAEGGKDVFKGIGHTFKELTGEGSDAESAYENLKQQNEQVSSGAKGIYEYTDPAGRMAGMIAAMTATGGALRGMGVGEKLANAVNVGTTFWGDEKNKFRLKYPGDPTKQNIGATLMTTAYLVAPNAVPAGKINKLMTGLRPEMEDITSQLANGSITKEAAKSKALYAFEQALKFGKTAGKQELKGVGEMTAITAFGQGLDKALGLSGVKEKEFHPEGELEDVAKTMLIGNAIPSLLFGAAGIKSRPYTKESLYEMASNPKRFQNVLHDQMLTDPEGHSKIEAKLNDLDHLVRTKAELDAHTDLTPEQKKQYILHDYNEQILKQKAETVTNEFLKGKIEDQIKKSKEIKENIFKGKSTDILPQEDHLTAKEYKEVSEIKNDKELFDYFVSKATKGYASTLKAAAEMEGDSGVKEGIKYMQDKAVENPKKFREDFGDALTEKMLDKATTQEIGDSYYNLIDINSDDPSIPILEKLLDEREAKGEVYKPKETESTSDAEANQSVEPAKESQISVIKPGEINKPDIIPLKTKENAPTEQSAAEVDVRQPSGNGKEMGSGNAEPPVPPGASLTIEEGQGAGKEKVTGIKNAISYETRGERSLPKVDVPEYGNDSKVVQEGKELVDTGKINPRDVVTRVLDSKGGFDVQESKAMQYYMHQLSAHEKELHTQLSEAETPEAKAEVSGKLQQWSDEMDAATQANIIAGKSWSDIGNIRQIVTDEGFNPSRQKAVIKDAYGGEMPKDVQQRVDAITKERDEAMANLHKVEEKLRQEQAKKATEKIKNDAAKQSKRKQTKEELKKEEADLLAELKKSIKKDANNLNAGIPLPVETLKTISKLLLNYGKQGIHSIEGLVDKLHEQLKDEIEGFTKKDARNLIIQYQETEKLNKKAQRLENELIPPILDRKGKPNAPKDFASTAIPKEKLKFRENNEWVRAQQRVADAEFKLKVEKRKAYESSKNYYQRGLGIMAQAFRLSVLSGVNVLNKLAAAAVIGGAAKRIPEQVIGAIYSQAFKGIAQKAPIEGFLNAKAEAKFYKDFFNPKKFVQNSWEILKTGESNLSKRFGAGQYDHTPLIYLPTDLHQIIKDPVKRATFEASFHNGIVWAEKNGLDINDELVIHSLETAAYKRANYEIFQEQNWLSRKFTAWKNQMEKSGNVGATGKFLADFMIPVSTVPTNIVRRLVTTSPLGLIRGGKDVVNAYRKGIENLKPEEADAVMKQLKQGTLGTALWMIGWFGSGYFGGLYSKYNPDKKRKEGELAHDEMSIDGKMIPKPVQHALPLEVIQWAATARHIYDNYHDRKQAGNFEAIKNAGLGSVGALVEQIPVLETGVHAIEATGDEYEGKKFTEDIKRRFEPQILRETGIIKKEEKKKKH